VKALPIQLKVPYFLCQISQNQKTLLIQLDEPSFSIFVFIESEKTLQIQLDEPSFLCLFSQNQTKSCKFNSHQLELALKFE